jgi:uncharacterized protein (DUF885 family)
MKGVLRNALNGAKRAALLLATAASVATVPATANAQGNDTERALTRIMDEVAAHRLDRDAYARLTAGLPLERLPDPSRAAAQADARWAAGVRARLARLNESKLPAEAQITRRALLWELGIESDRAILHPVSFSDVTPYASPLTVLVRAFEALPLETANDRARYARVQSEVPAYFRSVAKELRARDAAGVRLAAPEIPAVLGLLRAYRVPAERSGFVPAASRVKATDSADAFVQRMAQRYSSEILPALDSLIGVFDSSYVSRAPTRVGMGQYPGGLAAYRLLVKSYTTTDLTPEAIHAIGLREVARIEQAMAAERKALGFTGTAREFLDSLRRDSRFYARVPDEVGARLTEYQRRIEPVLGQVFKSFPRAKGDVRRLDPRLEASQTFGYYDPPDQRDTMGHYYYNASQLDQRSLITAGALLYHELLPGHHLQVAGQLENEALPALRRVPPIGAFTEGWGDYASALAGELGMYRDPYERYGRLLMDMFISCRLVVDTGMNALGWSRDSATAYMAARVIESPTQLATETLRYSTDIPAQALSYKIGAVELFRLREVARAKLGATFDLREFHEVVLGSGALPMTVLEWKVNRWIAGAVAPR